MLLSSVVNTLGTVARPSFKPGPAAAPAAAPQYGAPAAEAAPQTAVPSFITLASLASVSGGTTAVTLLSEVAKSLFGNSADTPWVPFLFALIVGAVIYLVSVGDKNVKLSGSEKVAGMFIAFLNSMVLFGAARGFLGR